MIFWNRPQHLTVEEADAWVREELRRLTGIEGIARAELTRLTSASERHGRPHDWMLELHLAAGAQASDCLGSQVCAEWLGDLRLLGMRPSVMVADDTVTLPPRAR